MVAVAGGAGRWSLGSLWGGSGSGWQWQVQGAFASKRETSQHPACPVFWPVCCMAAHICLISAPQHVARLVSPRTALAYNTKSEAAPWVKGCGGRGSYLAIGPADPRVGLTRIMCPSGTQRVNVGLKPKQTLKVVQGYAQTERVRTADIHANRAPTALPFPLELPPACFELP